LEKNVNVNQLWIAFFGIFNKEVARFLRGWLQTLLPSAITTILYFLVFGEVMGPKIGAMDGYSYTVFITPGLVMLAVITNSYSNVVSSFYGARFTRSVEEMLVSPMPSWLIILGYTMGGVVRGLLIGLIVLAISSFFAGVHLEHFFLALILIILCSSLFALGGFLNGIFARKFDDLVIVPTFILTPLIYLGGVFFSISELPPGWKFVSYVNPVHYLIDSFRYALLGVSSAAESISLAVCGIVFFVVALFFVNLYLVNKGIGLKS
jgi:ABC-2 type transport system permease protein